MRQGHIDRAILSAVDRIEKVATDPAAAKEIRSASRPDSNAQGSASHAFIVFICAMGVLSVVIAVYYLIQLHGKDNYARAGYLRSKVWVMVLLAVLSLGLGIVALLVVAGLSKYFRNRPIACDVCGTRMHKLPEDEDNKYLTPAQDLEEQLKSVDYDVWLCPKCGTTEIFPFVSKSTTYKKCPHCHTHALRLMHDRIEVQPTTLHKGRGIKIYECMNCHQQQHVPYEIAKTAPVIIIPGGRGGGGGGGISGGSWGGGSFGGGGAGGSW